MLSNTSILLSLTIDPEQCFQWFVHTDAPAEILVVPHVIHHALALLVLQHIVVLLGDTQAANTVTCTEHSQCSANWNI